MQVPYVGGGTRPGARGALLYESCIPVTGEYAFGPWPDGVPVQVHGAEGDEFFQEDLAAAQELVQVAGPDLAELFTYRGEQHLFVDSSLASYDPDAAALLTQRSLDFLALADQRRDPDPTRAVGSTAD